VNTVFQNLSIVMLLSPLIGSIVSGVFGQQIGRRGAHWVTIIGIVISFVISLYFFKLIVFDGAPIFNGNLYTWGESGSFHLENVRMR